MKQVPRVAVTVSIVIVAAVFYYTYFLDTQTYHYGDVTVQEAKRLIEEKPDLVVLDVRTPLYERAATLVVDTTTVSLREVADLVMKRLPQIPW